MRRSTPFADIVRHLTPFFVSRQVVCGAGRVGIGQDGREHGFQISQRADYFEVEVGLETTLKRPIINTRDEPHADPEKYRRLHVIIGDANLAEISTYLKVGTTALVLAMIEDRFITARPRASTAGRRAARRSRTTRRCKHLLDADRRPHADRRPAADGVPRPGPQVRRGPARRRRRRRRPSTCWPAGSRCSTGSSATRCCARASSTGWPSCKLLEQYRDRDGLDWDDAKLQLIDLPVRRHPPRQGALPPAGPARPDRAAARRRRRSRRAMHEPPEDTRAYFRGRCLEKYADPSPPPPGTR